MPPKGSKTTSKKGSRGKSAATPGPSGLARTGSRTRRQALSQQSLTGNASDYIAPQLDKGNDILLFVWQCLFAYITRIGINPVHK